MKNIFAEIFDNADAILEKAEKENELNFFDPEQPSWEEAEEQTILAEIIQSIPNWGEL